MRMTRATLFLASLMTALGAVAQGPEISIETATEAASFAPGSEARALVKVELSRGWKANANEPLEDFLIPTVLSFGDLPEGITLDGIFYPEPTEHFLEGSDQPMAVYNERFNMGARFLIADDAAPGDYELEGSLRYQACDHAQCWRPETEPIAVTLTVGDAADPGAEHAAAFDALSWEAPEAAAAPETTVAEDAEPLASGVMQARHGPKLAVAVYAEPVVAGQPARVAVEADLEDGWHINSHEPLDQFLIPTVLTLSGDNLTVERIVYPEAAIETFDFSPDPMAVYEHDFVLGAEITAESDTEITLSLRYQACDDAQCLPPYTGTLIFKLPVLESAPDAIAVPAAVAAVNWDDEGVETEAPAEAPETAMTEGDPDWDALLADFTIAGQDGGYMRSEPFIAFIDAAESGEGMGPSRVETAGFFGRIIMTLIGGLLLNLTPCVLPLIPINLAIIGAGARASSRARGFALGGAYGLGITAVFGALGLIVVFGLGTFGGGINSTIWFNAAITALFVVLGFAMFGFINIDFSKYQAKIGQHGKKGTMFFALFMGGVSALLAGACVAPLLIAVLLYAQDAYAHGNIEGLYLPFLLGLGMALPWPFAGGGLSMLPKPGGWMNGVKYAIGIFIIGFGVYYGYQTYKLVDDRYFVDREAVAASMEASDEYGWHTQLVPAMAEAKAEGKPLLIDFWATWCKNCLVMNDTTFKDEAVLERLDNFVKVKYQAEDPSASPHAELLEHFDRYIGFPFYVVLMPDA
jgi:thiol:disulfide interchange protein DsbD